MVKDPFFLPIGYLQILVIAVGDVLKLNLIGKIVLLVAVWIVVATTCLVFFISHKQKKNALETATASAQMTIEQFKTLRAYYAEKVIAKTQEAG